MNTFKNQSALIGLAALALTVMGAAGSPRGVRPLASTSAGCSTDTTLCLSEGRFLVGATWTKPDGESGIAHAVSLTPDSGYFWFFEPDNVEVALKTLDGCSVNGRYWVFSGGMTNLEVAITVTDTTTNEIKTYANPQGRAFQPIADSAAFSSCSAAAKALSRNPEEPAEKAPAAPTARASTLVRRDAVLGCSGQDTVLCLNGRFQVEATWQTASGQSGPAHAAPLTSEAGYFWFFEQSNVELVVKTLDACTMGRGQWFFAAGMTTVGVELKVTDTFTGEIKTYANPLGISFPPVQDTAAFAFCPTPTATPTPTTTPTPTAAPGLPTRTPRPTSTPAPPQPTVTPSGPSVQVRFWFNRHFSFSPLSITIHAGQTVTWIWSDGTTAHSTTSGTCPSPLVPPLYRCHRDGQWDSGSHASPFTFSRTFPETGTFPYFDATLVTLPSGGTRGTYHHGTGTVVVEP